MDYFDTLAQIHRELKPKTYLEIGTESGLSLRLSRSKTIAIDPEFRITALSLYPMPVCMFFQTTSDEFFTNYHAETLLQSRVDFAFIDGMHLYEYALRDFINVEKTCNPHSLIAFHDVLPTDPDMIPRNNHGRGWTGDVWKTTAILQKYRPDLCIMLVDSHPTGLLLVTNLNPNNTTLTDNYDMVVSEFRDHGWDNYLEWRQGVTVTPAQNFQLSQLGLPAQ